MRELSFTFAGLSPDGEKERVGAATRRVQTHPSKGKRQVYSQTSADLL